jgi:regulator of cell morphogenesis and NO signaling
MIQTTDTLASLARTIPAASRVFHRHRLDFCCGGNRSLADVCATQSFAAQDLIAEIEAEKPQAASDVRWDLESPAALVEHILDTYHAPLRPEVERLLQMARKVERVHAEKATCPRGLAAHLAGMQVAIDEHLEKEEKILFPMILSGQFGFAAMPIQVMVLEHDDHGAALRKTRVLTKDLLAPAEACTTWQALYVGLEQLERDLMDHIHLENHVLFPMVLNASTSKG